MAEAEDRHRLLHAHLLRALRAHDDDGAGAVGDQRAVVAAERRHHRRQRHVFVERQRLAQLRVGVLRAVPARGDGDRAELLARACRARPCGGARSSRRRTASRTSHRARRRRADGCSLPPIPVFGLSAKQTTAIVALAGLDRHRRVRDHHDVGGAALVPDAADASAAGRSPRRSSGRTSIRISTSGTSPTTRRPRPSRRRRRPAPCGSPRRSSRSCERPGRAPNFVAPMPAMTDLPLRFVVILPMLPIMLSSP